MRIPASIATLVAAIALGACTYVERPAPTPAFVQAAPAVVAAPGQVVTVPPGVTVRPAY